MTTPERPPVPRETAAGGDAGTDGGDANGGGVPVLTGGGAAPEKARRFWSVRRIPAALLAAAVLGGAGLLLYDVAAVRADRDAMSWRRELADGLATRPLDDTAVLVGAAVAVLIGVWLLVLAATPGLRAVLPMRRTHPDLRAGLDREAAAFALRDRAMEVSGVQSVKVRVGRSKVAVRAVSHFRPLDDVRADVESVLADGVEELGLARPPALTVRVDRPSTKG
ncbi:hypothetical protein GCM10010363_42960 [Streptomyces omiyaensis]|uniref:DUF6286 domain-containing protein n=1 Tax=Streptomyces omiyaensis TaxID=68247 RepID=UPI001671F8D2|nr:DUF6286 domain-containing protein [Streptomyces omiyaensis]GGY56924.1 hypothetical protein GCM10010363_42960 [Streptomyces omiyaensis]